MKKNWLIAVGSVLILEGMILLGLSVLGNGKLAAGESGSGLIAAGEQEQSGQKQGEKEVWKIYERNKKNLILVNTDNKLKKSYKADLRPICSGRLEASKRLYEPLVEMLDAAEKKGHRYWIASAYRSYKKQQRLVDEDVRKEMQKGESYENALEETYKETMPAGHSEHQTGLALDILCSGNMNMDTSQEKEAGNVWLRENCWRYGFILRYPKGKKKITGINYEPWHFRYVGKEAAAYIKKHDLTLEEFWDEVKSH